MRASSLSEPGGSHYLRHLLTKTPSEHSECFSPQNSAKIELIIIIINHPGINKAGARVRLVVGDALLL